MTHEPNDKRGERDFEAYLEGDSEVSKSYARLKDVEPPMALDRSVLAQAKTAADETRRRRRPPFWASWSSRIAGVAVVTLAVAVTLRLAIVPETLQRPMPIERERTAFGEDTAFLDKDSQALVPGADTHSPDRVARAQSEGLMEEALEQTARQFEKYDVMSGQGRNDLESPVRSMQADVDRSKRSAAAAPPSGAVTAMAADEAAPAPSASPAGGNGESFSRPDSLDMPRVHALSVKPQLDASGAAPGEWEYTPWRADPDSWLEYIDLLIEDSDEEAVRQELAAFREDWPDVELAERYEKWLGDSEQ